MLFPELAADGAARLSVPSVSNLLAIVNEARCGFGSPQVKRAVQLESEPVVFNADTPMITVAELQLEQAHATLRA